tara:strand:+ start:1156 stop:1461 length:306 start_codon:yes stop_codon:yes gene_type:complete
MHNKNTLMKEEVYSNIEGQNNVSQSDTLNNILDSLPKVLDGVKGTMTSNDGYTMSEQEKGTDKENKGYEVKILGMKPLVFILVSLGTIIIGGIVISRIGKK